MGVIDGWNPPFPDGDFKKKRLVWPRLPLGTKLKKWYASPQVSSSCFRRKHYPSYTLWMPLFTTSSIHWKLYVLIYTLICVFVFPATKQYRDENLYTKYIVTFLNWNLCRKDQRYNSPEPECLRRANLSRWISYAHQYCEPQRELKAQKLPVLWF